MKRIIVVALMCALFSSMEVIAQPVFTNQQIAEVIFKSKEINRSENGVLNPNLIFPGQRLTFMFMDGYVYKHIVKPNESQWDIVEFVLTMEPEHGKIVDAKNPYNTSDPFAGETIPETTNADLGSFFSWPLLIVALVVAVLLYFIYRKKKRNATTDLRQQTNAATDHPMRPGGVPDREAASYMQTVAIRAGVTAFGPVTKGRLTTTYPVRTMYSNGGREELIQNEHVFHSKARNAKGEEVDIFYKQICGNDACQIDMKRATFVPDPVQSEDLQVANNESGRQQIIASMQPSENNTAITHMAAVIAALVVPMTSKECGILKIEQKTSGQFTIDMSFGMKDVKSTESITEEKTPVEQSKQ